ncbi:hypothetical protein LQ564_24245 [Massilia sp. G4R7]|uniref:DUF4175 domain-containing protein n=1 Tax=Massilia phyllostachyos TaxID=2898585 RepID=A0ABS8QCD3_9BURK|nr:hypothetical protein [Massilia phyllostachyos]MCD2519418.1 hypothetical protein [Massilia phyllostachyos]
MIRTPSQIWAAPILLGILTTIGLIAALLGDGGWDLVSAVTLGAPVLAGIWYGLRRAPRRQ